MQSIIEPVQIVTFVFVAAATVAGFNALREAFQGRPRYFYRLSDFAPKLRSYAGRIKHFQAQSRDIEFVKIPGIPVSHPETASHIAPPGVASKSERLWR